MRRGREAVLRAAIQTEANATDLHRARVPESLRQVVDEGLRPGA